MKLFFIRLKQLIAALLFGLPTTMWLLMRNTNTVYYVPHVGLGDYCIALGYLDAYKKRHQIAHITLIVPPNRIEVAQYYPCWDSIIVLPQLFYMGIAYFGSIPGGRFIHRRTKRIKSVSYMLHLNKKMLYNNPAAHADHLARLILKLPDSETRKPPHVPDTDISHIVSKYDLNKGKTVLLNPYTGGWAVKELEQGFYVQLAKKLTQAGYTAVTILSSDKQVPIEGTKGLVTSLAEAWYLAGWCGWLIGTRSGFFDFVQFSGCNIIAFYEKTYKLQEMFALLDSKNSYIEEFVWDAENSEDLMEKVISNVTREAV